MQFWSSWLFSSWSGLFHPSFFGERRAGLQRWVQDVVSTACPSMPCPLPESFPRRASPEMGKWLYEAKLDGFRALALKAWEQIKLISRNGKDLSRAHPPAQAK